MHQQHQSSPRARFPAGAWALLAVSILSAYSLLPSLMFGQRIPARSAAFLVLFYAACATLVLVCHRFASPALARRLGASLASRMAAGLILVAALIAALTLVMYGMLYPLVTGTAADAGHFATAYRTCMAAVFVYGWLIMRDHARQQAARALSLRTENDALRAAFDQSRLAMLEAQIEPHFLFNTLAHVKRLYRMESGAADQVMRDLIAYLERSLPALSRPDWRVDNEVELVTLYLNLVAGRFGDRLRFSITVGADANALELPPLTIATLVENAVRHGLGPKAGAGHIVINICVHDQALQVDVVDDGVGLRASSGNGVGLATVRARLRGKFGDRASLLVAPADGGGVRASMRVLHGGDDA